MPDYDAIVIGTGQAGPFMAWRLAAAGMKVAVVERKWVGGTCVNTGCTPTKALVASAYAAHLARRAADYGVTIGGPIGVDMKRVKARKDEIVLAKRDGQRKGLETTENITFHEGHARFRSSREVSVGETRLKAPRVFINVGGRATVPPIPGIEGVPYLTNTSMMDVDFVPPHLIIVGGSYIGLEFGQMYRRFGSKVTIVEMAPRPIQNEDEDVSAAVHEILAKEGIDIRLNAKCIKVAKRGDGIVLSVDCATGAPDVVGSHLLLAVGRRPNTDDLGLDAAGVARDQRGFITVDDQLQTNVPGIWALGDCNGRGAFTHTSYNDFEIVAANLLDGAQRRVSDRVPVYGLFTDPPLGRVGMTLTQAKKTGKKLLAAKRPMTRVARAVEKGETQGFMKFVVDADTKALLGAAILGPGGDEAVHCVVDVMSAKAPYTVLQNTMHIHPTVAELIPSTLEELKPVE
ncbi:MAG TPA: FAD-containing oxidoreductase [Alphaproteobacteria bacterium]|jgi:pyruvate/2-oxoglutarate dehydrogenase complex dihydrolipoamide dehydrogenase (E3) component|nr:FAD-containing oxidoreductase [Alphaproteobacteria bacterium]